MKYFTVSVNLPPRKPIGALDPRDRFFNIFCKNKGLETALFFPLLTQYV